MIKRRHFLQATLATAGAVITGCGDGDTSGSGTTTTTGTPRTLEDGAKYFPQSVASGDPRPDGMILWTRVEDEGTAANDVALELELSPNVEFSEYIALDGEQSKKITALASFDHCAKVRLASLSPATVYYYRFIYEKGGKFYTSKVGRTKTAPAADADVEVKFAYVSCQDYIGRYYNSYSLLLTKDLDFIVHLGDYVYETEGDPTFQNTTGRKVTFTDAMGAIELKAADGTVYHAAKSLSNYRDLYKTYRSDAVLQKAHETFAMIATWDDHEFSDDCHGATASYFDGKQDETDVDRRRAANQAWFEYMPVDYLDNPDFAYDPMAEVPNDIKIWRDYTFGKNVHLVMTDLRTHRADHIIPEEAFPGTVVIDEATLVADYGEIPAGARPYVDIDDAMWATYKTFVTAAVTQGGGDATKVTGNFSVLYINALIAAVGAGAPPAIDDAAQATLPKGIAYIDAGKGSFNSSIGSRYFCPKPAFDVLAKNAYKTKASQDVMGTEQEKWFLSTITGSTSTWKVWGNEYPLMPITIDLTTQNIPEQFKQVFYMDLDSWDGFRDKRSELFEKLTAVPNVVAITGDIHAFYAATPWVNDNPDKKIVEFVGGAVTSGTYRTLLKSQVEADPVLKSIPGAGALAGAIDTLLKGGPNPHLGFADSGSNGFVTVKASSTEFVVTYYRIPEKEVTNDLSGDATDKLAAKFKVSTFKAVAGEHELYMLQDDGKYMKWNPTTQAYE